jgi:hypothetical protein
MEKRRMQSMRGRILVLVTALSLGGCGGSEPEVFEGEEWAGDTEAAARLLRPHAGTPEDWQIVREKAGWAWELGLDTLSMGESMAFIGVSFVGTKYVPATLELPGAEQVVVNLQELDCVTFVENTLALALFIRQTRPEILESEFETQASYRRILTRIRYRGGRLEGYPSRLHYFTDWILDNEAKGIVREVTADLDGEEDYRAIDFMSTHPESYRQLSDPVVLNAILDREFYLSGLDRHWIPKDDIGLRASWIEDGDIIAATSAVDGLDVAHTGLAFWRDGQLHLLHAPLVGESVEVSDLPLADRILRIERQDGIRVVRPLEPTGERPN